MLKKVFGNTDAAIIGALASAIGFVAIYAGVAEAQAPLNPALTAPHAAPATTSCTLTAGSTDYAGQCSATATSGVAVTFSVPFNTAPNCIVKDRTTASGDLLAAFSTTGFTLGTTVSADKISWICVPNAGG